MTFHKILCPIDFSPSSRAAMHVAAELARDAQAMLVLVHIWEPRAWLASPDVPGRVVQDIRTQVEGTFAEWKAEARGKGGLEVLGAIHDGVAWDRIVDLAREDPEIDLIAMGTHGRGLEHAAIGSVAERVVRLAPCAVLVVRPRPN
jgi:nucleotide-binding universal stress UspA family protein